MQRPDQQKRQLIIDTAARFFATQPFHKVRLDDIAAAAKLGKGTLYIYFDSKEELFFALICEGFAKLVDELRGRLDTDAGLSAIDRLAAIVGRLVGFAFQNPHFFELMRTAGVVVPGQSEPAWREKRLELQRLVEDTIRQGVDRGELCDPHPELTALCLPGMVRSLMLFGPPGMDEKTVSTHMVRLLTRGIANVSAIADPCANGRRVEDAQ